MKHKDQKTLCVYAGPEVMARIHAPIKDDRIACPKCGGKASADDAYCAACGFPLKPQDIPVPPPMQAPPQEMAMATYAGPDFYNNGMPAGIGIAMPAYPQNYQDNDEEPIDVYAGPPIDCDE